MSPAQLYEMSCTFFLQNSLAKAKHISLLTCPLHPFFSVYAVGTARRSSHSALVSKEADTDCVIDRHSLGADCKEG